MGTLENESQIGQNYILHIKFLEFYLYNHNSCEIWHLFSPTKGQKGLIKRDESIAKQSIIYSWNILLLLL